MRPPTPSSGRCLDRAAGRLEMLCAGMLYNSYPRLTGPPLNLERDELLGAVVERLLKALRKSTPEPCVSFSHSPTSTCAGSSMTWPDA